jgi:nitroimidazol reductase NimA-like FMN-containing flavoprotein (pyridoxamine 5'-phosphate oxidase superfamily)
VKERLLRRDPRVSVSVHDGADGYRWTRIEGTVVEFATGEEAERHIDVLSRKYHDGEPWTYQPDQMRVLLRVRPDRIYREE